MGNKHLGRDLMTGCGIPIMIYFNRLQSNKYHVCNLQIHYYSRKSLDHCASQHCFLIYYCFFIIWKHHKEYFGSHQFILLNGDIGAHLLLFL